MQQARGAIWLTAVLAMSGTAQAAALKPGDLYVAMGSSYGAGPGITTQAIDSPGNCAQSNDNYARQIARALKLKLVDRTCGGAVTAQVLKERQAGLAPQIEAVTADTRLVTVTIGGNDIRYNADLSAAACRTAAAHADETKDTPACGERRGFELEPAFVQVAANLREIASQVRRRAPQARLMFVDYVTAIPPGPPCAALSLSADDAADLRSRHDRLAALTEQVAKEAGADIVKGSVLTKDHDACAAEPWVAGDVHRDPAKGWQPVGFHPLLPSMTAIAQSVVRTLGAP
jgi:lysophospholipase L1-like esterase